LRAAKIFARGPSAKKWGLVFFSRAVPATAATIELRFNESR
jgi:hypothetical protein